MRRLPGEPVNSINPRISSLRERKLRNPEIALATIGTVRTATVSITPLMGSNHPN